eukprot:CAMPEP_0198524986 /NCGR_PEP_ID=MMETSP1462-20131121/23073_1 /TAXON_ID=1333877 /ORGANISM="Brandtodinium nutriculum, Strain RCC3387" /LENGTH=148 /DNA_ID=CAMNT_0044254729 /DNA_START=112 /DNA_END=558 /DNA_ORIENTATION=+
MNKEALVNAVKSWQRQGEGHKQSWYSFVTNKGTSNFDPNRHDEATLMEFVTAAEAGKIDTENVEPVVLPSKGKGKGKGKGGDWWGQDSWGKGYGGKGYGGKDGGKGDMMSWMNAMWYGKGWGGKGDWDSSSSWGGGGGWGGSSRSSPY